MTNRLGSRSSRAAGSKHRQKQSRGAVGKHKAHARDNDNNKDRQTSERRASMSKIHSGLSPSRLEFASWEWNVIEQDDKLHLFLSDARLLDPSNTEIPEEPSLRDRLVLVSPETDLFSRYVREEWLDEIFEVIEDSPDFNFLVITRYPTELLEVSFPDNCWVGVRILGQNDLDEALQIFGRLARKDQKPVITFILVEVLDQLLMVKPTKSGATTLTTVDWLILGHKSWKHPDLDAVELMLEEARNARCSVFFMSELTVRPQEYPEISTEEPEPDDESEEEQDEEDFDIEEGDIDEEEDGDEEEDDYDSEAEGEDDVDEDEDDEDA